MNGVFWLDLHERSLLVMNKQTHLQGQVFRERFDQLTSCPELFDQEPLHPSHSSSSHGLAPESNHIKN